MFKNQIMKDFDIKKWKTVWRYGKDDGRAKEEIQKVTSHSYCVGEFDEKPNERNKWTQLGALIREALFRSGIPSYIPDLIRADISQVSEQLQTDAARTWWTFDC